jgi:hypothetical protein
MLIAAALAAACSRGAELAPSSPADRPHAAAKGSVPPEKPKARLVVVVVIDQLPSWVLARYLPVLDPGGALRSAADRGAYFGRVVIPFAATYTAPGHAAIHTGLPPSQNGVPANETWSDKTRSEISIIADARYPGLDDPGATASPGALLVPTVADVLDQRTRGAAKIVSLSLKDRAAVLSGGKKADFAAWYDAKLPGFTSSRYYAARVPDWLERWRTAHPLKDRMGVWQPLDREKLAAINGGDSAPGEADWLGLGAAFPHDPSKASDPYRALRACPSLNDALLDLADHAVRAFDLGADETPDLLALSISTLDYVGHIFGPESWEYLDAMLRVDAALGAFLRGLERTTNLAVLITSDHGAAPLPERSLAAGRRAGRIFPEDLVQKAEDAADRALGPGAWISGFSEPFLYFTGAGRAKLDELMPVVIRALQATESVHAVYDVRQGRALAESRDALERSVGLGVPEGPADRLYVVPRRWFIVDPDVARGFGTSHGSPWDYDREIPVLAFGAGVPHEQSNAPLDQRRIAATVAALLGVPAPNGGKPLFEERGPSTPR